jgi:hypothetical protein
MQQNRAGSVEIGKAPRHLQPRAHVGRGKPPGSID